MKKINLILALVTTATLSFGGDVDGNAVLGSMVGAGVGSAVGSAVGGKDGAIIGGGAGGAVGAAVGSKNNSGTTSGRSEKVIYKDDDRGDYKRHRHHDNGKHKGWDKNGRND